MTSASAPTLGLIGLGIMGRPIGHSLLRAGFPLTVFNRTVDKASSLIEAGAKLATSVSEVATQSDLIFICLPDTPDVDQVLFGPKGIAATARHDTVVIDCSTIAPHAAADFARR